jgi:mannose-6-phosphate isomerase-like protein (cupin superfamily)
MSAEKVNMEQEFAAFDERWKPKIAGELFLVVKGRFRMECRDWDVWIEEGEFIVVPRGVEHRPVAEEEAHVLLFEPASTLNTGNVRNERTVAELDRI